MKNHEIQVARLLLVEDEAIVALSEKKTLEKHGYEVITAYTGEKAVESATQDTCISLVLMDIDLGSGIDGTEAAEQILQSRTLPIVFLTGHSEKEYVDRVKKITSYGYVLKNSGEFVLIQSIEMAFCLFDSNTELKRQRESLRTALVQQENTEEELQINVRRYRQLFDNIDSCVAVYEAVEDVSDFIFIDINKAAEKTDNIRKEDVIGKRVTAVFPEVKQFGLLDVLKRVARTGTPEHLPVSEYSDGRIAGWRDNYVYKLPSREIVAVYENVTERKEKEKELEEMYSRLQTVIDNVPFLINEFDGNGHYILVNEATCEVVGLSKEQLMGKHFREVLPPETATTFQHRIEHVYATGEQLTVDDRLTFAGEQQVFRTVLTPILGGKNTIQSVVGIAYDVSHQVKALEQKDLFMQELNHRTKNNLHLVASLVDIKDSILGSEVDLSDIRNQINAIANVHEALQHSDRFTHINLKSHVTNILSSVFQPSWGYHVSIDSDIPDVSVPTEAALPLGLIINETATNALQHGFTDQEKRRFIVVMEEDSTGENYILTISNTGRAFPDEVDIENPKGLGLQLVSALVAQLQGSLELQRNPQPVFTIRFPVSETYMVAPRNRTTR